MKLQITYLKTNDLLPYAGNSRTHSDEQVNQIAASIKEFGFAAPICVAEGTILAGHGRVMAARKLGLEEVPTVDLSHLTPAQRRQYVVADNKLAMNAGWDEEMLAAEIALMKEEGSDLDVLGFTEDELAEIEGGMSENKKTKDDEVNITEVCQVIAECENEEQQAEIYKLLTDKGIKCRVATL